MNYYFTAKDLMHYVVYKYDKLYKKKISSIKLQKTLYFLYAFWCGTVNNGNYKSEKDIDYRPFLFNDKFQAWIYGPVLPNIFKLFTNSKFVIDNDCVKKVEEFPEVVEYVDDIIVDIFKVSDFRLVDMSHQDKCWINNFKDNEDYHNNIIPEEEIVDEYSKRLLQQ